MAAPYPEFIPQAFAMNAAGPNRNVIPDITVSTQRASWNLGYPPLTMTPVIAGGKPMLGPDMNGVLYMLSSHAVYQQSGKLYQYDADVVVAIGGYAVGTLLGSVDGSTIWYNVTAANTTDPDASGAGWVAMFAYGMTPINALAGGLRTLTLVEASKSVIVLTGALAANQQVVLPTQLRRWLIVNACTGAFPLTVKTAAGSGVVVPQGGFAAPVEVYGDGTNIYNVVAPVNLPIDQNPVGLTIVQRTNAGYVLATYFNQSSGLENAAMSAVIFETANDGYFRKMSPANFKAQIFADAALTGNSTAVTQPTGTNNTTIATTAFVQQALVGGTAQAWTDQTASRAFSVVYTNTTGRPIQVNIGIGYQPGARSATLVVNGVLVGLGASGGSAANVNTLSAVVPDGGTYFVTPSGGPTLNFWAELR